MNRVSVVLCTYNGAGYIEPMLESIASQEGGLAELIIYDDGSSDDTVAICSIWISEFARKGIRVRLLRNDGPSRGAAGAFSFASRFAEQPYVAFADQDDVWSPRRLTSSLEILENQSITLFGSDATLTDSAGVALGRTVLDSFESRLMPRGAMLEEPLRCLIRQNYVPGMTMTVRRDSLRSWLPVPSGWMHDYWIALCAAATGGVYVSEAKLVDYRQHELNVMGLQRQLSARRLLGAALQRRSASSSRAGTADWIGSADRLADFGNPVVDAKVGFEIKRASFADSSLLWKLLTVFPLLNGYRRFSHLGLLGVAKDVLRRQCSQSPKRFRS